MHFDTDSGPAEIAPEELIIAGWTGRDSAAVQHHIEELAAIGVAPPSTVPLFYRASESLLTTSGRIQVVGATSSGEAEPLVIRHGGALWLGLGSDHTDRALEAYSVAASKQACPKPCAAVLWRWDEVADRLDSIELRSWIREDGDWVLYQDGTLAKMLPLDQLIAGAGLGEGAAMLCGTLPAIGGVRPSPGVRAVMRDPANGREIHLEYEARELPVVS